MNYLDEVKAKLMKISEHMDSITSKIDIRKYANRFFVITLRREKNYKYANNR